MRFTIAGECSRGPLVAAFRRHYSRVGLAYTVRPISIGSVSAVDLTTQYVFDGPFQLDSSETHILRKERLPLQRNQLYDAAQAVISNVFHGIPLPNKVQKKASNIDQLMQEYGIGCRKPTRGKRVIHIQSIQLVRLNKLK